MRHRIPAHPAEAREGIKGSRGAAMATDKSPQDSPMAFFRMAGSQTIREFLLAAMEEQAGPDQAQ